MVLKSIHYRLQIIQETGKGQARCSKLVCQTVQAYGLQNLSCSFRLILWYFLVCLLESPPQLVVKFNQIALPLLLFPTPFPSTPVFLHLILERNWKPAVPFIKENQDRKVTFSNRHFKPKYKINVLKSRQICLYFMLITPVRSESHLVVSNSATPWAILSMKFSRPEYQSGQPFPSPGNLPTQGSNPGFPDLGYG